MARLLIVVVPVGVAVVSLVVLTTAVIAVLVVTSPFMNTYLFRPCLLR